MAVSSDAPKVQRKSAAYAAKDKTPAMSSGGPGGKSSLPPRPDVLGPLETVIPMIPVLLPNLIGRNALDGAAQDLPAIAGSCAAAEELRQLGQDSQDAGIALLRTPHGFAFAPMKDAEVAAALDVSNSQAKAWLQRLVDEGVIEKQKKSAGYIVKQSSLFE
mgnify:CR=1 FL=1